MERKNVIYGRFSTAKQKVDLDNQMNDTNIPLESSSKRNCFHCNYFSEIQCHGSRVIGECLKKENMVWCPPTRYHGIHKDYKTVFEDDICQHFEQKDS